MRPNFLKVSLMMICRGLEFQRNVFDFIQFKLLSIWGLRLRRDRIQAVVSRNLFKHLLVDGAGPVEDLRWMANTVNRRLCIYQRGDIRYETCLIVRVHSIELGIYHGVTLAMDVNWISVYCRIVGGSL